jgi:ribosome biogenesis GTPase
VRGRIQKALSGFYYVDTGTSLVTCRARGKFRREGISPLVGDWVEFEDAGGGAGIVTAVEPRINSFTRPSVANIDQLVVFASAAIPVTDPFLIDRISTIAVLKHCQVLVCINKDDLNPGDELYDIYAASGIPVLRISACTGDGLSGLKEKLSGKLSAFTGNSGVGKSSVLNALNPALCLPTNEVSRALGRGKHTTRHVELYPLESGTAVIDTPGFSSFDTEELDLQLKEHLPMTFPEFVPYLADCRYIGCSHTRERGCAVLAAVADGKIQKSRHASYVRLYEELKDLKAWEKNK